MAPDRRAASNRFKNALRSGGLFALAVAVAPLAGVLPSPADAKTLVAEVPLPRVNPARAGMTTPAYAPEPAPAAGADPIGALLSNVDDERTVEDSDAPQAGYSPVASVAKKPAPAPSSKVDLSTVGLRYALKFLDEGNPGAATAAAYALPNPVDVKIIDWLIATSGRPDVPASRIAEVWRKLPDWPGQTLLQTRWEQALVRERPSPDKIIQAMSGRKPVTSDGTLLLVRSYMSTGRRGEGTTVLRTYWREGRLDATVEANVRKEFGELLTAADYKARMDSLLYDEQSAAALRNAKYLDKNEQALAAAVVAVNDGKASDKLMAAVPAAKRSDPLYVYSKIRLLRRANKADEAAQMMLSAPRDPDRIDGDAWWIERRLISRTALDQGDARTAYRIAAAHSAETSAPRAEAEFHAGWYALEYLNDPATAKKHFATIQSASSTPLTQSRAAYWLGRAEEKSGNMPGATAQYRKAGSYPTTFYGQLALHRLGTKTLPLRTPRKAGDDVKQTFNSRELVQAIKRLDAANRGDRNDIFIRALAEQLEDPAELSLLAAMAESEGNHPLALQVGKIASSRGLPVDTLAFPTSAIPSSAKTTVEKPMVYAIARQESAFNPGAVSSAGARGLLQLMPATAKQTAKAVGLPYSQGRLTSDPGYNATLGSAHLKELFGGFGGSYVMTFAAYNAGGSRVRAWVEAYGDPRDPNVDVVNWIERIPFTETRNYVQRIMENLQVYRARLGSPALTIATDLKRGKRG